MTALYFTSRFGDTNMKCSGSIIHDLYILTTAHCVYYEAVEDRRKENKITVHLDLSVESILCKPNETALVTGWGTDVGEDGGKNVAFRMRRYLKEVNLTLQSKENCDSFLKKKSKNMKFTERMLCAGGAVMEGQKAIEW
ncbi:uncharacterized protein LOC118195857 isoform X2 [Stegodyphus dumicola]|uniref:uncharacterized protein LOC118195857 isoform X2 n=1 Tax=Stegodyphus dumicola TaxID=202533 RepID=UPI0015B156F2|nr:uncharacterized protein LOC118195857 isoform X2 [Stegodyphus dumicola]